MQSVSSRIWTRVAVSISYDDNHYTTGTSWQNFHIIHSEYVYQMYPETYQTFLTVTV